jgi:hypothetical protein
VYGQCLARKLATEPVPSHGAAGCPRSMVPTVEPRWELALQQILLLQPGLGYVVVDMIQKQFTDSSSEIVIASCDYVWAAIAQSV